MRKIALTILVLLAFFVFPAVHLHEIEEWRAGHYLFVWSMLTFGLFALRLLYGGRPPKEGSSFF